MTTSNNSPAKPVIRKRPVIKHGRGMIQVPELSGPVGRMSPVALQGHKVINSALDVAVIDYYLAQMRAIKWLDGSARTSGAFDLSRLFSFVNTHSEWEDRCATIASFQQRVGIKDTEEITHCFIKPDGETLIALVDYGDQAEKLLIAKNATAPLTAVDYVYIGHFERKAFIDSFKENFAGKPRYDAAALPALLTLLGHMERDSAIMDIRWMAYMFATVFWETTSPAIFEVPVLNKKGKVLVDKSGRRVMRKKTQWRMTMSPVDEVGHGKGRPYYLPVKVKKLPNGTVRITEQDGDQFIVFVDGKYKALERGSKPGSAADQAPTDIYDEDDGDEFSYFGRGYVQLTWWHNYASGGVAIGKGMELLLDPEKAKDSTIAYAIMSHGMRTGFGFANGKKFPHYFFGMYTDYVGARAMVNGSDHATDIAAIAASFEKVLLKAKL